MTRREKIIRGMVRPGEYEGIAVSVSSENRRREYVKWIEENVDTGGYRKCREVTEEMVRVFPELRRVRGHYRCLVTDLRYQHWWCVDPSGAIVDPTVAQFTANGLCEGDYEAWDEGLPEPTGKCINCGEFCYNGDCVCSRACADELSAAIPGCRSGARGIQRRGGDDTRWQHTCMSEL